jgi:hypothetical protein
MNGSYDRDRNLDEFDESAEPEREISLGTSTVLGIFFALALVCALFFGSWGTGVCGSGSGFGFQAALGECGESSGGRDCV